MVDQPAEYHMVRADDSDDMFWILIAVFIVVALCVL